MVWQSGPTPLNSWMIFQDFVSTTATELLAGFGCRTETNILLLSIEKQRWKGLGYSPTQSLCSTNLDSFFQSRGSRSDVSNTAMLFWVKLFIWVKISPSGEKPASWATHLHVSNFTSHVSGL